jgi:hypothetical protein
LGGQQVPCQPGLHSKTLFEKEEVKEEKKRQKKERKRQNNNNSKQILNSAGSVLVY